MYPVVGQNNFIYKIKSQIFYLKFYLSCQGSKLNWQMQWLLNKLLDKTKKSVVCSFCHKEFSLMLEKEDFIATGKAVLCPECQNALWIEVGLLKQTTQFPFSQLFLTKSSEAKNEPAHK